MSHPITTQTRRFRVEWLTVGGLLVFLGVVLSFVLYRERILVEARESDRLQVQARVIDENLIRQLEGVSNALAGFRNELENSGLVGAAAATSGRLKLLSDAMPGVRSMVVLDARGIIVASSRAELLGTNSSQRDFFATPRQRPNRAALYVSAPFKSPLGPLVIVLGRVLTSAQGEFAGVVLATLNPDYFQVVLRSVLYAPDMRTSIAHGDGQVFVNTPVNEQALGMNLAKPGSMFTRHQQSRQTFSLMTGRVLATGDDRMMAIRSLDRADLQMDKPLVAAVSRELSAIYLPWRDQAMRFGLFYAVVVLSSGLGLHFSQRRRKVLDRLAADAAKERQQNAERLELALQGADLGLWDLDVPTGNFVINPRERALLGFSPDDELPQGGAWRDLIHPDDRALVDSAILPHLRGEVTTYGCEHRMMHKAGYYISLSSRAMIVERDSNSRPLRIIGTHLDITERTRIDAELRQAVAELRTSEDRLSLALEGSGLALFDWDIDGDRIYHSAQASAMRDEAPAETTASPAELRSFVHRDDLVTMQARMKEALTGAVPVYYAEFRLRKRSGAWVWVRARGRVVERDAGGRALRLAGTYADINERKLAEERLRHRAEFDTLTDLPNRALFVERLQQAMRRATSSSTMALLFLDIDHFKTVNDTLGHEAGDQLLKVFAERMRDCVRQSDTVARLAGDEFTVILEGLRDPADAKALASKLVETLRAPTALAGKLFEITTSVGVALWNTGDTDEAEMLRRADVALYEAKRRGRNCYFCEEADTPPRLFETQHDLSNFTKH